MLPSLEKKIMLYFIHPIISAVCAAHVLALIFPSRRRRWIILV